MTDAAEYRKASRERWGKSARGWQARREQLAHASMPVTARMVDAIAPQPGHELLELAAGIGDTGFYAAELIQPGGTLICSDFSPEMLSAAQERALALGLSNVRFKQIDGESIDLGAGSLDGVLCRWGYMLMADPAAALRESRRILRQGGRLALAAWTGPDENLWSALPGRELVRRGHMERPRPEQPGQFAWADPGRIEAALQEVGFVEDLEIERVGFELGFASFETWWATQRDLSSSFAETVDGLAPDEHEEVRAAVRASVADFETGADGGLTIPAATWVAAGTA
ncbi:MAG: class I SAM-dependent methyltransferase [Solirubrobacterales bacterium]|jgi:SAM-dependent methyltransferase|nr:class I SAM-dependent methyltransferase [Solirubrobacterales bacterium]